jgi:hypothetical protein
VHFLKVLVPAHKPDEDLFERTDFFHVCGEAKEAGFCLVELTILQNDASWSCGQMINRFLINLLKGDATQ